MLTVGQSVRILSPEDGVDALRRIEYAGRACYRSHDRSSFFASLRKRQ